MKNFFLFLAVLGISISSADASQPVFGPISITPLGSGITITNPPGVDGNVVATDGAGHFYFTNNGSNTNGAASGALTGDVTKPNGSLVTTIAAGHITAAMMANDLDTNVFSATGIAHLFQLLSPMTNSIDNTWLTNRMNKGLDTNVFSASGLAHLQSLFTNLVSTSAAGWTPILPNDATKFLNGVGGYTVPPGGSGPAAGSNTLVSGSTVHLNNAMTNIQSIGFNGGGVIQGSSGATASGAFNRIAAGTTNGFVNTYNVIDFGASPALSDNSTAIQNALNAASTNGGRVFIPAATNAYTCRSTIVIPNHVMLEGEGTAVTSIGSTIANSISPIVVQLGDVGDNMINHMLIQGGSATGTQIGISTSGNGANATRDFAIENTAVKSCGIGIYLSNCWDGLLLNDYVQSCTIAGQTTNYANSIRVIDGHYSGIIGWEVCGQVAPVSYNIIFSTTVEGCSNAFRLDGANWADVNITGGLYSEGNTNFIVAGSGKNLNVDHTAFTQTAGTTTTNIVLRGTSQVSMDHSYFFNSVAFDADSATFGLSFDKNYVESGVTWNNRATTSTIDDNTNIVHTGKSIYGPSANFGSLVLTNLSGTAATRMLGVDGSGNVVTNPPASTYTNEVTRQINSGTNLVASTNVLISSAVLASSGNQTNYTIPLYNGPSGNLIRIFLANTNAFLTFTGTNSTDWQRTVWFDAVSNSVVSRITLNVLGANTNLNWVSFVTNATSKIVNFYNPDTTGTNMFVSDAGTYSHR